MNPEDTFTFEELRISLTAFAIWLLPMTLADGQAVALVDQFIKETTE